MNYYIDTEFLEGTQKYGQPWFNFWLGPKPKTKPTIDLISIGIVAEDGREYYAISKDFNLREAWNRWQIKEVKCSPGKWDNNEDALIRKDSNTLYKKDYWIRENVLLPIYKECISGDLRNYIPFSYSSMKFILKSYGKTNQQIAEEIKQFVSYPQYIEDSVAMLQKRSPIDKSPNFYAYFADYDWVAFCWLFGKMNNLPNGFPKYCIDLKQEIDRIIKKSWKDVEMSTWGHTGIENIERLPNYPKQTNEHNALADAKWNKELHEFIQSL